MILPLISRPAFFVTLFFSCTFCLFAVPSSAQKFSLGVRAGASRTWSVFGDREDRSEFYHNGVNGFSGGGFIQFPLKKDYSCQIEAGYSHRGRKISAKDDSIPNQAVYRFADAALILRKSFNLHFIKNVPSKFYAGLGPQVSYWLSGKGLLNDDERFAYTLVFNKPYSNEFDAKMYLNDVNRWLFGINLCLGFEAPVKSTQRIAGEIRFTSGHTFYGAKNSANYFALGFKDNLRSNEKTLAFLMTYTFDFDLQRAKTGKSTKDKEVHRKPVKKKKR
jgi:hypothetical protein